MAVPWRVPRGFRNGQDVQHTCDCVQRRRDCCKVCVCPRVCCRLPSHCSTVHTIRRVCSYQKIHLFDVDIPGGPRLKESRLTLPGSQVWGYRKHLSLLADCFALLCVANNRHSFGFACRSAVLYHPMTVSIFQA
jgi:hypothetical protein